MLNFLLLKWDHKKKHHRGSIEESAKATKKSNKPESKGPNTIFLRKMLFLTSELGKKEDITILPGRENTRPGLQVQAVTSWVERKGYIRESVACDSHLGL